MSVSGNIGSLGDLRKRIAAMPIELAERVARDAAHTISQLSRSSYTGGRTAYGTGRPRGAMGRALDLVQTGATLSDMRFVSTGMIIRAKLGPKYAKYLVGKYAVLPGRKVIPSQWSLALNKLVSEAVYQVWKAAT